jgi:GTP-binding protein
MLRHALLAAITYLCRSFMSRIVAIVGRPNVGKSTLFNRLVGSRMAIVEDSPGVTRDRHYGSCEWNGETFTVVDTGGFVHGSDDIFEKAIRDQVKIAVAEAEVILFMVDVTEGVHPLDTEVANLLRKSKKPVLLVVNKVDNNERLLGEGEFYSFGLGEIFSISSASGSGTGEVLDKVVEYLTGKTEIDDNSGLPKVAIIGKPNVGKSSFINALLGTERNIVTDIAGTTRDTIHTKYNAFGKEFMLIDTAGIRKKQKVNEDIEFYSVMRSIKALEDCDVCGLMIDANQGIEKQDLNLLNLAEKNGKGVVILVNKWDLVEKDNKSTIQFERRIQEATAPFTDIPVVFISAQSKQRIHKAVETILQVSDNLKRHISTHELNEFLAEVVEAYQPPAIKGKFIKIKFITQLHTRTPSFALFCNLPQYIQESYRRYIENKFRERYDFSGVPLRLYFRKK